MRLADTKQNPPDEREIKHKSTQFDSLETHLSALRSPGRKSAGSPLVDGKYCHTRTQTRNLSILKCTFSETKYAIFTWLWKGSSCTRKFKCSNVPTAFSVVGSVWIRGLQNRESMVRCQPFVSKVRKFPVSYYKKWTTIFVHLQQQMLSCSTRGQTVNSFFHWQEEPCLCNLFRLVPAST